MFHYASLYVSRICPCFSSYTRTYPVVMIGGYVSCYCIALWGMTYPNKLTYSAFTLGYGIPKTYSIRTLGTPSSDFLHSRHQYVPLSFYGTGGARQFHSHGWTTDSQWSHWPYTSLCYVEFLLYIGSALPFIIENLGYTVENHDEDYAIAHSFSASSRNAHAVDQLHVLSCILVL